jgi:hypothetical protein
VSHWQVGERNLSGDSALGFTRSWETSGSSFLPFPSPDSPGPVYWEGASEEAGGSTSFLWHVFSA